GGAGAVLRARPPPGRHCGPSAPGRRPRYPGLGAAVGRGGLVSAPETTVGVELGARRYDVRIGNFAAADVAAMIAGALGPVTGVAVLVDADVGKRSPRVAPLVEA